MRCFLGMDSAGCNMAFQFASKVFLTGTHGEPAELGGNHVQDWIKTVDFPTDRDNRARDNCCLIHRLRDNVQALSSKRQVGPNREGICS